MSKDQLTDKQKKVLDTIIGYVNTTGRPPTIREIQVAANIGSLRGVTLQLEALEEAGFISRSKTARGINLNQDLLKSPQEQIEIPLVEETESEKVSVPLMTSTIPAGLPTLVEEHSDRQIDVTLADTKGIRNIFAVQVSGDSMVGSGIVDGDIALITPQVVANDGDIVAALHENGVTLKKFRIIEGRPVLFPTNPQYKPITEEFSIQGKLVNIIKKVD